MIMGKRWDYRNMYLIPRSTYFPVVVNPLKKSEEMIFHVIILYVIYIYALRCTDGMRL